MFIYLIVDYAFDELHLVRQLHSNPANRSLSIALAGLQLAFGCKLFNIVDELFVLTYVDFRKSTLRQTRRARQ